MTILYKTGKKVPKIKVSFWRRLKDFPGKFMFGDTTICVCDGELKFYRGSMFGRVDKCNRCGLEVYTSEY